MKKTKILLPIYLILSLIIIISTVVVSLTAGINLGIDFVGGKQIEVQVPEGTNASSYENKIEDVLNEFDLSINTSFEEDKYTDTYFIVKINTQEMTAEEKTAIREAIIQKLELPAEYVSEVFDISGSATQKTVISVAFAILGILVVMFIAGWIRYGIMNGLSILFAGLHNLILSLAVILLTRVELTISSCVAVFVASIMSMFIFCYIQEKAREGMLSRQNKELSNREIFMGAIKSSLVVICIISAMLFIFSISSLFIAANFIKLFGVALLECIIVALYSVLISTELASYLSDVQSIRDKQKLSKNVTTKKKTK